MTCHVPRLDTVFLSPCNALEIRAAFPGESEQLQYGATCVRVKADVSRTCVGVKADASRTCLRVKADVSRTCVGVKADASRTCLGAKADASRTCLRVKAGASRTCAGVRPEHGVPVAEGGGRGGQAEAGHTHQQGDEQ